jgi:hypothetical protein
MNERARKRRDLLHAKLHNSRKARLATAARMILFTKTLPTSSQTIVKNVGQDLSSPSQEIVFNVRSTSMDEINEF